LGKNRETSRRGLGLLASALLLAASMAAVLVAPARTRADRTVSAGLFPAFYLLDGDYFGMDTGIGTDLVVRYEVVTGLYIENRLGGYSSSQDGSSVTGINGQLGVTAILPYLIPWRPSVRLAGALLTMNPVISEPVTSFRPSQTVFYLVGGAGITRILRGRFQVEFGADLMLTPYTYRIYDFHRQYVETKEARFAHLSFSLGLMYSF